MIPLSIFEPAWLLQTNANRDSKQYEFDLFGALPACIANGGLMWLGLRTIRRSRAEEVLPGATVFLWECGFRKPEGSGRLVAVTVVQEGPRPHAQFEWQAPFRAKGAYDPDENRVLLRLFSVVEPPVWRNGIKEQVGNVEVLFFRQPQGTTYLLEPEMIVALADAAGIREIPEGESDWRQVDTNDRRKRRQRNVVWRPGQNAFQRNVAYADQHRCVVTGTRVAECLEAAHIIPHRGDQTDHMGNGMLLRVDIHRLFDAGLLRIHPVTRRVVVDEVLDGTDYEQYRGVSIDARNRLDRGCLEWRWQHPTGDIDQYQAGSDQSGAL